MVQRLTPQVLEPVTESIEDTRRFIASEIARATRAAAERELPAGVAVPALAFRASAAICRLPRRAWRTGDERAARTAGRGLPQGRRRRPTACSTRSRASSRTSTTRRSRRSPPSTAASCRPGASCSTSCQAGSATCPPEVDYAEVIGHGMNAEELAANPRLDRWFTQDLNADPGLPLADASVRRRHRLRLDPVPAAARGGPARGRRGCSGRAAPSRSPSRTAASRPRPWPSGACWRARSSAASSPSTSSAPAWWTSRPRPCARAAPPTPSGP